MSIQLLCLTALWNGVLTAVSPCPLTTNITAISYLSQAKEGEQTNNWYYLVNGLSFMLGRVLVYVSLSMILLSGLTAASELSLFLQRHVTKIMGPVFVLVGMVIVKLIEIKPGAGKIQNYMQKISQKTGGVLGAFLLGGFLALSFCPLSAALFFGTIAMAAGQGDASWLVSISYALGSGIPVILISLIMAVAWRHLNSIFKKTVKITNMATNISGILFIVVGLWYCLRYSLRLF